MKPLKIGDKIRVNMLIYQRVKHVNAIFNSKPPCPIYVIEDSRLTLGPKRMQKGSTNHVSSTSNDQLPRHLRARRRAWRCPLGCLHFARCHLPPWTQRLHQHHHLCPICKKNMYTNKTYQKMYRNVHLPSLAGHT